MRLGLLSRWYVYAPISAALLAFVVWRSRIWELEDPLGRADPWRLAAVVGLNAGVAVLWAIRSGQLLAHLGHRIDFRSLVLLVTFANTINNLTPASTGEVARAALMKRRHGVPIAASTAVILIERFFALYLMAVTVGAAWMHVAVDPSPGVSLAIAAATTLLAASPSIIYAAGLRPLHLVARVIATAKQGHPRVASLVNGIEAIDENVASLLTDVRRTTVFVLATLAIFGLYALQLSLAAGAFGFEIGLAKSWAILGLATIVGVLSAMPFGLGAADATIALALPALAVATSAAAVVALTLRALVTLPLGVAGATSYALLTRSIDDAASPPPAAAEGPEAGDAQPAIQPQFDG